MIVSRRNDTVLCHWSRPVVLCLLMVMYILNDSKKLKLVCVKAGDSFEFKASRNGNPVEGILSRGIHYNWIAFPSLHISCQLADFSDSFWNREQLSDIFDNDFDVETVLMVIEQLRFLFDQDHQSYTDGHKFMSSREYIFWLENQCEILSCQMVWIQTKFEDLIDDDLVDKLLDERVEYHNQMRFQYDDTIFE